MEAKRYAWSEIEADHPISLLTRQKFEGEKILVTKVELAKGCHVAIHSHASEQVAVILSGRVLWKVGSLVSSECQEFEAKAGDVVHLPSHFPHGVDALEDTLILDILSPPGAMGVDNQS